MEIINENKYIYIDMNNIINRIYYAINYRTPENPNIELVKQNNRYFIFFKK